MCCITKRLLITSWFRAPMKYRSIDSFLLIKELSTNSKRRQLVIYYLFICWLVWLIRFVSSIWLVTMTQFPILRFQYFRYKRIDSGLKCHLGVHYQVRIVNHENIYRIGFLMMRYFERNTIDFRNWPRHYNIENLSFW